MAHVQEPALTPALSVEERFREIAKGFENAAKSAFPAAVAEAARLLSDAYERNGKLLVFGNGGSASDAQHLAGELVVRFQKNRRALGAIALCCDGVIMTACSNDFAYDEVFARQVEALARPGDVAIGISTSGASPNVLKGLQMARGLGVTTILMTGQKPLSNASDYDLVLAAPGANTARVQELHLAAYHMICELIEARLFSATVLN
jgi:D-sedoheptulose 7-phosphate isomerase